MLQRISIAITSPAFYGELVLIVVAVGLALLLASVARRRVPLFRAPPAGGAMIQLRSNIYRLRTLLAPVLAVILLGLGVGIAESMLGQNRVVQGAQGIVALVLFAMLISSFVRNPIVKALLAWVAMPVAILYVLGWLDEVSVFLESQPLPIGMDLSLADLIRILIFGTLLFWLGSISNAAGKNVIRTHQSWNVGTRELVAKLFEIGLFFIIFVIFLQIVGINLTALAVFGGALGIGLGFGLQQIASNFISGIIILLDRSIAIGDFIELEDGRSGVLRALNMRHGILETYDGKDIMVPNEQFITSSYTNWTHKDKRQRYPLNLQVAYSTDLDLLFEKIREICREHPKVLSGPDLPTEYQPDAEIAGFGDSGIDILVEFWMNGIDDGENRVGADLLHSIWRMIKEQGMEIPFPQREIRIIGGSVSLEKQRTS